MVVMIFLTCLLTEYKLLQYHVLLHTFHMVWHPIMEQMSNPYCIPVRSTYGGYYGLVVVTPRPPHPPRPQTLHRLRDNLENPYRIASIFYM